MVKPSKESIMQIYVLKDEVQPYELEMDLEQYEWLVYWYENGCYDGFGEAVALRKDGRLQTGKLDHCSCYGPFDGWAGATPVTVEELFAESDNIHDRQWGDPLRAKVKELLGV
jgi:hypothetical protein